MCLPPQPDDWATQRGLGDLITVEAHSFTVIQSCPCIQVRGRLNAEDAEIAESAAENFVFLCELCGKKMRLQRLAISTAQRHEGTGCHRPTGPSNSSMLCWLLGHNPADSATLQEIHRSTYHFESRGLASISEKCLRSNSHLRQKPDASFEPKGIAGDAQAQQQQAGERQDQSRKDVAGFLDITLFSVSLGIR